MIGPDEDYPETTETWASALSADGTTVVGWIDKSSTDAVRWRVSPYGDDELLDEPLGYLSGSPHSEALGVSADGNAIVGRAKVLTLDWLADEWQAFLWTEAEGMEPIGPVPQNTWQWSAAYGISDDGTYVVGRSTQNQIFAWSDLDNHVELPSVPGYSGGAAHDVRWVPSLPPPFPQGGSLEIVGRSGPVGGSVGFSWESFVTSALPGNGTANAISTDGSRIVGRSGTLAVYWEGASVISLGLLGGDDASEALAVSADGSVILGKSERFVPYRSRAFIWTQERGMLELSAYLAEDPELADGLIFWDTLYEATGISDDGTKIAGTGLRRSPQDGVSTYDWAFYVDLTHENDTWPKAKPIATGSGFGGTLGFATATVPASCGGGGGADRWYLFTAPHAGTLHVDTCGTNDAPGVDGGTDTVLSLHSVSDGSELAGSCSDDYPSSLDPMRCTPQDVSAARDSYTTRSLSAGEQVLIRAGHYGAAQPGPYALNIEYLPEPGGLAMLGSGGGLLLALRRRRSG